jgi:hypothetical protein
VSKAALKKLGSLVEYKDMTVADAIRARGGTAATANMVSTDLKQVTVEEAAERAAQGDAMAETAIKLVKQASSKAQKYG